MECPLLSVIIPAYNLPDCTRKTLQSLVEQEYHPIEVILSDDCLPPGVISTPVAIRWNRIDPSFRTPGCCYQKRNG